MAKEIDPTSSMAALFGSRVRRLRLAAGLTQTEVGRRTHVVGTRITQVERSLGAKPTRELAQALDEVLQADDLLVDLWPYVYREAFPDWSRKFMNCPPGRSASASTPRMSSPACCRRRITRGRC